MNNATAQYFISCVSKELGSYRRMLKHHLSALRGGVEVKIQEDFIQGNDTLLEELNAFVRDCEGVIHLVGERCGELPTDQHVQVLEQLLQRAVENRYSMTQWEYHLARHHDKRTLVYLTGPETRIDEPVEQHANAAAIQQAHRVGIHESGKFYGQFNNHQQLRRLVFRDLGLDEGRYIANLPFASLGSLFKGRDEVLTTLKDGLGLQDHRHYQGVMAITANTTAASVHGLGGIGKTRAAVEFAVQYREDYCALLFCIADTPSALMNNIAAFCGPNLLDLPAQHEKETEVQYQAALHWLKQHPGWLLIIDNVDNEEAATAVQKLAGELSGSGQILITSRISDWPGSMLTAALDVLDSDAAIAFLLERTDRAKGRRKASDDEQQAALLAETLGYLPLALEQAGAYICIHEISFAEYLTEWESKREIILDSAHARVMEYPFSVAVTWLTSFDKLTESARHLLYRLAWFSFEPIPESLLETNDPNTNIELSHALVNLTKYSLASLHKESKSFSTHNLVQEVTRKEAYQHEGYLSLQESLIWLDLAFHGNPQYTTNWSYLDPLQPHVRKAINFANKFELIQEPVGHLMNGLGKLLTAKAQYLEAEHLAKNALQIGEKNYGPAHINTAVLTDHLASIYFSTNRLNQAEQLMRQSIRIFEQHSEHQDFGICGAYNNLAVLLMDTNRTNEAETLIQRALNIFYQKSEIHFNEIIKALTMLAQLKKAKNQIDEAEPLLQRAITISEKHHTCDTPDTANALNSLALLFQKTNRLNEAVPVIQRALATYVKFYGLDHPATATFIHNYADILQDAHIISDPEPLMRRAISIHEKTLGQNHPDLARGLSNMSLYLKRNNRLEEAEPFMRRALKIFIESYGINHPETAIAQYNLARLLNITNRSGEALKLAENAIQTFILSKSTNGHEDPSFQTVIRGYSSLLVEAGLSELEIKTRIKKILSPNSADE